MTTVITLSTEQTICLIVFHAQQALASIKASHFDDALKALITAEEFLYGITSKSLPLKHADQPIADTTLDIPERHSATTAAQVPSCCGHYFEQDRGPCCVCKRHDDCLTLTRRFEAEGPDSLLHQNWKRASVKDKQMILRNPAYVPAPPANLALPTRPR